jgi:hypothetical protein
MSGQTWWGTVLQWTLWALVMSAVMGWLGRTRMKARPAAEAPHLRHPTSTLITGVVGVGFFTALAVVSVVTIEEDDAGWIALAFMGFALLAAPMLLDYYIARHEVSEEGLAYRKLNGMRKFMRWSEVRSVRVATTMKWFRLEDSHGNVARLSFMLMGLPEFARLLLRHAPDDLLEPELKKVLRSTAEGNPPSVWV